MKMRVKIENEEFEVEVEDLNSRPVIARVGDETFEVWPEEAAAVAPVVTSRPAPVVAAPVAAAAPAQTGGAKTVTAPLPGTIIVVQVKAGDKVTPGKELLVLEAMKMKNAIRATRAGTIAAVHVTPGQTVSHNQPLLDYAD